MFFSTTFVVAQEYSNLRISNIKINSDTILIDSLSIIPNSLFVFDNDNIIIHDSLYSIDFVKSLIIPNKQWFETHNIHNVKITYKVFPYNFSEPFFNKDFNKYAKIQTVDNEISYTYKPNNYNDFFKKDELLTQGSISRGITFGNNQDVVVNSTLNLQMSGKLNENFNILAAISDNNIPIQPEGNTQQIQDFDKVFIQLYNDKTKIVAGDFNINKPLGLFMNINKKAQGGFVSSKFKLKNQNVFKTSVSGAVSKGKYNRMSFNGIEGKQGPYKLQGANNEAYIMILSGTEKIYIDGRLLKRGLENDYIINYNSAEISFTANQLITKDKRIVVEFEYSDRNYARFLLFNSNEFHTKKSKFYLNVFSEQDSKNQPIDQDLTNQQKQLLANIGDSLNMAVVPNVKIDTNFNGNYVFYKMIDTVINSNLYDSVFVYSTNADVAIYRLGFSYVGENNGNYVQGKSPANGKVFEWTEPINGQAQGNYEPVVLLITPKKNQMVTFGGETFITKNTEANFEVALSNNDINSFSKNDAGDDLGYALKLNLKQNIPLTNNSLTTSANFQHINKYFKPIERFKTAEFERDWNLKNLSDKKFNENLLNINLDYLNKKLGSFQYNFDYLNKGELVNANKNTVKTNVKKNKFDFNFTGSWLNSKYDKNKTDFLRYNASLSKQISFFSVGIKNDFERNLWNNISNDSLIDNSYKFDRKEFFISNSDSTENTFFAKFVRRKDYLPSNNELKYSTLGEDYNFGLNLHKNPKNTLKIIASYRKLTIEDSTLSNNKADNSLLTRLEHNLKLFKGVISSSTFFEISKIFELKKEFSYLEVSQGQGLYAWTDYNSNDIKELNEFEIANFKDQANYIRIFTPTNQFVQTYKNQFNQILYLKPRRAWHNEKGVKKFISRFSNQFAYRISKKTTNDHFLNIANPIIDFDDLLLVNVNYSARNILSFNKTNTKFGLDYVFQNNKNKMLLVNGFDNRSNNYNGLRLRWNINKNLSLLNDFTKGDKTYNSESFSSKNYDINYDKNKLTFSFQPNLFLKLSIIYKYIKKINCLNTEESTNHDAGFELKYSKLNKGTITMKANYLNLTYNANTNTPIAYEMLDGFFPGDNLTWDLIFQKNVSKKVQININYSGRWSEDTKIIHTGTMQIRAIF
ncbi:MAG: hypothetical protein DRJ01_06175 [Bacteroidetes bacterium]|nr:MAG: hypothetical protein DRJ01_06175 [Bacteroidota bacterium]